MMDEAGFRAFVASVPWRFAASMPQWPHEYTVRPRRDGALFESAVLFIREYGTPRAFREREYVYYEMDGREYWTMGNPLPMTKLINRAKVKARVC